MSWCGRHRLIIIVLAAILVIELAVQLVYPYDKALPFARLIDSPVGTQDRSKITQRIQKEFHHSKLTINHQKQTQSVALSRLGAVIDADAMATELTDYPLFLRLLPGSLLWYQPQVKEFNIDFGNRQLDQQLESVAKEFSIKPLDAALAIDDGQLVVTESKNGYQVKIEELKKSIISTKYSKMQTTIAAPVLVTIPQVDDASISSVREQAEAILARPISITITDSSQLIQPSRSQVAKLLKIEKDLEAKSLKLSINKETTAEYAQEVWRQSKVEPKLTTVNLIDGKTVSKDVGKPGLGVDRRAVASEIETSLMDGQSGPIHLEYQRQSIASPISYKRDYTSSQQGLNAYVSDQTAEGNTKIAITQLGGPGWTAQGGATDSIPSASTYKLYIMLRVFNEIENGKISWNSKILDTNVSNCFERTIVLSANDCSEEWLRKFGRSSTNSFLRTKGFSPGTVFPNDGPAKTTAADLNKFLVQLENSTLVTGQNRTMLLEKMSRQIYRQGVPAGSGAKVYDKVGFLWDYVHDAAIVRHPKGTYVIVVMTKGDSYQKIAGITKQVERILYK